MFRIPPKGHPAREAMGDIDHLVELLDPANLSKLPTFAEATGIARRAFTRGLVMPKAVYLVCLRANDERWLIKVGPRGGCYRVWNFGTGNPL